MAGDQGKKKHRCRICQKSFPSGRSLGGHMRSHAAPASPENTKKQCRECGKCFQSWKALFGHMRCHSSKIKPEDQEEVALTLMMLSRDTGEAERSKFGSLGAVVETDDEVFDEGKNKKARNGYECAICHRSFESYQAFGGHCAAYRRNNGSESSSVDENDGRSSCGRTALVHELFDLNMPAPPVDVEPEFLVDLIKD